MLLLLTVLFSSWLYIAVSVPAADRTRPDEVQAVVARFSGESAPADRTPSPPSPSPPQLSLALQQVSSWA